MDVWVYMVRCADGRYYIGSHRGHSHQTRVNEHNAGLNRKAFTYSRRPVNLVWYERFVHITDAIAVERQLKGWSRAKKDALIAGDWEQVQALSKNYTEYGKPKD